MQNKFISILSNKYSTIVTSLILGLLVFWWISDSTDYRTQLNNLYKNGRTAIGKVTKVVDNSRNEGNIHSWNVQYDYLASDSVTRTGEIDEPFSKKIAVNDSIYILYSKENPEFHVASLIERPYAPIGILSALFRIGNMFLFSGIIGVGIIFLTQLLYLSTR